MFNFTDIEWMKPAGAGIMFIRGFFAGIVFSIPLGPLGTICLQRTFYKGIKSGIVSAIGITLADTLFVCLAVVSLQTVSQFIGQYINLVWHIGLGLFFLLGLYMLFVEKRYMERGDSVPFKDMNKDFVTIFLLGLSSPAAFLIFINAIPVINAGSHFESVFSLAAMISGIAIGIFAWWINMVVIVNSLRNKIAYGSFGIVRRISGGIIIGLVITVFTLANINQSV